MLQLLLDNASRQFEDAALYLKNISAKAYSAPISVLSGATIGQHTRHFIEFFQCLAEAAHSALPKEKRVLNYDLRRRDHHIETDPEYALTVLGTLRLKLQGSTSEEPLWLETADYSTGTTFLLPASLERELLYNIEHAIHHFALIKIGLEILAPEIKLPSHFGVAPSTLYSKAGFPEGNKVSS
ncbi:MAG: DinB family protein [Lewinellaceae bacterium]|nr:DinB family protein [Lewinellaceae bacterium]